jgi:hypothetical protein
MASGIRCGNYAHRSDGLTAFAMDQQNVTRTPIKPVNFLTVVTR